MGNHGFARIGKGEKRLQHLVEAYLAGDPYLGCVLLLLGSRNVLMEINSRLSHSACPTP